MALVDDLRRLVGAGTAEYTAGGVTYWTNAQLQAALDARRNLLWEEGLCFTPERSGGSVVYKRAQAHPHGKLEPGTAVGTATNCGTICDSGGTAVTGWTIFEDGWVLFTNDQGGSARYIKAYAYDLYAAAADVLESWASSSKLDLDFSTDDQSFKRSEGADKLSARAQEYRWHALPAAVPITTPDVNPTDAAYRY